MFKKESHPFAMAAFCAALLLLGSCASGTRTGDPAAAETKPSVPAGVGMTNPNATIHAGDTLRMSVAVPGRKNGALETVQKNGDVATPDGSFIRADGVTLGQFRTDLLNLYGNISGYEQVQVEACIDSSPYKVVRYNPNRAVETSGEETKKKKSWDKEDFWGDFSQKTKPQPKAQATEPGKSATPAATLYPRNFNAPLTLWEAIRKEGGMPEDVDPKQVHILRQDLERLSFDCSGPGGTPDGAKLIESGDVIFLVPPGAPLHGIFE